MRKTLARVALILALLGLTTGLAATSAHADPQAKRTTWMAICDSQNTILCAYSDGTSGHLWYGKLYSQNAQAEGTDDPLVSSPCGAGHFAVQDNADGDDNCGGAQYWWPFTNHFLDQLAGAGGVVTYDNTASGLCMLNTGQGNNVTQGSCGSTGHLWVNDPFDAGGGDSVWIWNVVASDGSQLLTGLCANGQDNPLITDTFDPNSGCGATKNHLTWYFRL